MVLTRLPARLRPLLLVSLPMLSLPIGALAIGGCISERRPKREAKAAAKETKEAAPAVVAEAKAPTEPAPAAAEPARPPGAPPAGDPNHKAGEASRVPNYAVPAGDGPSKGPDDALVTIVEFNAFDCDACRKVPAILDRVLAKWPTDVRLVFRHAPMNEDKSKELSRAAVAAAAAGKFWEVHDELVTRGNLGVKDIEKIVADRGGDTAKFTSTLADEASAQKVQSDLALLDKLRGEAPVPILFVNGRYLDGAITFEEIDALVTEEKAKAETFMKDNGVSRSAGLYEDMRKRGGAGGSPWRGYAQVEGTR